MKNEKYRLLAIAPFKGFRDFFLQEIQRRNDIEADIYFATLRETEPLISTLDLSRYEAIICRGRSGRIIKEMSPIPVINVDFSSFDILRALQLAMLTTQKRIAFVSYFDLSDNIHFLCELLNYKAEIIVPPSPKNPEEMEALMNTLYYEEHISLFVGDGACVHCAKELNAESVLVTTGPESMQKAVSDAVEICEMRRSVIAENHFYKTVIEKSSLPLAIYNSSKELIYSGLFTSSYEDTINDELRSRIPKLEFHSHIKFVISSQEASWKATGDVFYHENSPYYLFHVSDSIPSVFAQTKYWHTIDYDTAKSSLPMVKGNLIYRDYWKKAQSVMAGKTPVVICGSPGSGRTIFSYALYASSPYKDSPLIEIDCFHLGEKQCQKIFKDDRSPLFENNYTILFKNLNALSASLQNEFCYYFENLDLTSRNKVICTFTGDMGDLIASEQFSQQLSYIISGFTIQLPTLNSRPELIVPIARSYLNELNQELPIQLAGFEPEALKLLESHHWEFGIAQFQTALKQLAIQSNGQLITADNVRAFLQSLGPSDIAPVKDPTLDLSQSLNDITKDIINLVLQEENMNQTRAAKRLGISRSTLWKKLQE